MCIRDSFSGITEQELTVMLTCLDTRKEHFPKDAFLMRIGDTAASIGLVLSGSVLIVQEDIWGNRNILSKVGPGQDVYKRQDVKSVHIVCAWVSTSRILAVSVSTPVYKPA